ncbi:hypothetical protein HXX76_011713 [Chlamydomonas incerta]|uniref:Uncharacterized protein n=1 Tax=Chlamydomonas incerta TaxID=51695 RepID=A0A835SQN5_CHLIN|nr:hypothetical protein HXX76_011713 [Chlamydomonas incerta]|eukprot:KAG2426484.1 hypothetical protein HXX76_011713 [Chlamydomonas incerta]
MGRQTLSASALAVVATLLALSAATANARKTGATFAKRQLLGVVSTDVCPAQQPSNYCNYFFDNCATLTCSGNVVTLTLFNQGSGSNTGACKDSGPYSWAACLKAGGTGAACGSQTSAQCSGTSTFKSPNGYYCNDAQTTSWTVADGTTQVGVQVHDGWFGSDHTASTPSYPLTSPLDGFGTSTCPLTNNDNGCYAGNNGCTVCVMTGTGIPNADCSPCSVISSCFTEKPAGSFQNGGTALSFLTTSGCTYVKTDGTYTQVDPVLGTLTFFKYPTTGGASSTYPYLNQYFAAATSVGAAVSVACYTDASLTTVAKYVMVQRVATAGDNYDCLTCKWYSRFTITVPAGSAGAGTNCRCSTDTAWAFPLKSTLNSFTATQKTLLDNIPLGSPYPSNSVYWYTRQDVGNAWGGFFRFAPVSGKVSTSTVYTFDMCAGCAFNQIGDKGFIMGRLTFNFTTTNGTTSSMMFWTPSVGATTASSVLQVYQSYLSPPTFSPGQFNKFDTISAVTTPFTYGTSWRVTSMVTGTAVSVNTGTFNVPSTMTTNTPNGVYVAVHMTVNGYYCDGTPPMN